jgi:hypothetical protein
MPVRFPGDNGVTDAARTWWPLGIPFGLGLLSVVLTVSIPPAVLYGSDMGGTGILVAFAGWLTSAVVFIWALLVAASIAKSRQRSFGEYIAVLFIATLPVAYYQAVNDHSSLMLLVWFWVVRPDAGSLTLVANSVTYLLLFCAIASAAYFIPRAKRAKGRA